MMHAGRVHHHAQAESVGGHSLCNQFCEEFFKYMYSTSMMPNDPYIYIYRYRFIDRNKYLHTYLLYMYREFIALGWFLHKIEKITMHFLKTCLLDTGFLTRTSSFDSTDDFLCVGTTLIMSELPTEVLYLQANCQGNTDGLELRQKKRGCRQL